MSNEPHPGRNGRSTPSAATNAARAPLAVPAVPSQSKRGTSGGSRPTPVPAEPTRTRAERRAALRGHVDAARTRVADLVWLLAVLAAIVLSLGALLVALGANADNVLVSTVHDAGHVIDGPFWKVFEFYRDNGGGRGAADEVKDHLVNWGLAAVGYLVVGRVAQRVIRP